MEKPLCKLCQERHYGLCDQASQSLDARNGNDASTGGQALGVERANPRPASQPKAKVDQPPIPHQGRKDGSGNDVVTDQREERTGATSDKAKFDRVAYQREYMRKRRAAK